MKGKKTKFYQLIGRYILLFIGAMIYSIGLEIFLIPNNVIDGGIVGISIITTHFTKLPLGVLTFILNVPFFIFGYKQIGKTFTISTLFSVFCYSIGVSLFTPISSITQDVLLASIFGGILIGFGVGLIIRNGGSTDGSEVIAIILDKKSSFSVGQIVMFFNFFILTSAGFVFGWDRAMYSLIAYFIAVKVIDIIVDGLDESKAVIIISEQYQDISEAIMNRLGRGLTLLDGKGAYKGVDTSVIYVIVSRLEISKVKNIVHGFDEDALITIGPVDVSGKKYKKKAIH
ncbi:YitT family protein [Clostridium fermenticellae]|uniref:YitT family protein n=1 Tax=Clostridium fermenticellae TaxID=2068654 RepID=A0A386H618_9CLOT|nr:YitT family protein [Clostridium fermenticellae]AYD41187.1 YitT family protein [Clostridium fermenticellae]